METDENECIENGDGKILSGHTNPFSIENGAVLLRFQKEFASTLIVFVSFFARPHYNAVSVLKTLLCPQCACSNELDACAFNIPGVSNRWNR